MNEDGHSTQPAGDADTLKPRDTTGRSLGSPTFTWNNDGSQLTVSVDVDLPNEPYGNGANDNVVYQVWGTMQTSSTAPNAVAWGTTSNRLQNETTARATPFARAAATPDTNYASSAVKDYYAVQVTVRKSGTTTQDDQTVKVYTVPAAP